MWTSAIALPFSLEEGAIEAASVKSTVLIQSVIAPEVPRELVQRCNILSNQAFHCCNFMGVTPPIIPKSWINPLAQNFPLW